MSETTFIGQRRFLWLWICLLALFVLSAIYLGAQPIGGHNGGTPLGLAYGVLAFAGILFLMWYGIRKRYSYARGSFTLKTWLGPHVWIGLGLVLLVPLHCGFRIRWNFHSASYLLMLLTVASGIWGAYAYLRFPSQMKGRREGMTLRGGIEQIDAAAAEMAALVKGQSAAFAGLAKRLTPELTPTLSRILAGRPFATFDKSELNTWLAALPKEDYQPALQLVRCAVRRIELANQLVADASIAARMRIWLYAHLPLSLGCLLAVAAHVFWVLYYRWSVR